ncbi:hypothetical protein [Clostridium sp. cel8]|nr:hypothetical protein [Clostridium sp. cel8]
MYNNQVSDMLYKLKSIKSFTDKLRYKNSVFIDSVAYISEG